MAGQPLLQRDRDNKQQQQQRQESNRLFRRCHRCRTTTTSSKLLLQLLLLLFLSARRRMMTLSFRLTKTTRNVPWLARCSRRTSPAPFVAAAAAALSSSSSASPPASPRKIAIVGGGLAGLATAHHLLQQTIAAGTATTPGCHITLLDTAPRPGVSGASAVAGGLIHPLSPRGKLIHWGLEGLHATQQLVDAARTAAAVNTNTSTSSNNILLCHEILRMAFTPQQASDLQATAVAAAKEWNLLESACEWLTTEQVGQVLQEQPPPYNHYQLDHHPVTLGALRLRHPACAVLHVPSYLQALWLSCQQLAKSSPLCQVRWVCLNNDHTTNSNWYHSLQSDFDTVVLAAGAGLFHNDEADEPSSSSSTLLNAQDLGVQLVRGQSLIFRQDSPGVPSNVALLNGKYVSPTLPHPNLILVGATHEYKLNERMTPNQLMEDLKARTYELIPTLWDEYEDTNGEDTAGTTVTTTDDEPPSRVVLEDITSGIRVQTQRGAFGRRPMIGKLEMNDSLNHHHPNTWIFTGLSSRGLIYHALYGELLATALLENSEDSLLQRDPQLLWWKNKKKQQPTKTK